MVFRLIPNSDRRNLRFHDEFFCWFFIGVSVFHLDLPSPHLRAASPGSQPCHRWPFGSIHPWECCRPKFTNCSFTVYVYIILYSLSLGLKLCQNCIGPSSFAPPLHWRFLELLAAQPAKATSIGPHGRKLPWSIIYQVTNSTRIQDRASAQIGSLKPNCSIKDHIKSFVVNQFLSCFPILSSSILKLANDLRKRNYNIVWISVYFGAPPLSQFHCWGPNKDHLVREPQHVRPMSQAPLWRKRES